MPNGKDGITRNVKIWIIIPLLGFQIAGFVVLVVLCYVVLKMPEPHPYALPALIIAFAGMPFGFASNVKSLINFVTNTN